MNTRAHVEPCGQFENEREREAAVDAGGAEELPVLEGGAVRVHHHAAVRGARVRSHGHVAAAGRERATQHRAATGKDQGQPFGLKSLSAVSTGNQICLHLMTNTGEQVRLRCDLPRKQFVIETSFQDPGGNRALHTPATLPDPTVRAALAFGLTAATLIQCVGHISGGHLNPAVTLAMLVTRNVTVLRAVCYIGRFRAFLGANVFTTRNPHSDRQKLSSDKEQTKYITLLPFVVFSGASGWRHRGGGCSLRHHAPQRCDIVSSFAFRLRVVPARRHASRAGARTRPGVRRRVPQHVRRRADGVREPGDEAVGPRVEVAVHRTQHRGGAPVRGESWLHAQVFAGLEIIQLSLTSFLPGVF